MYNKAKSLVFFLSLGLSNCYLLRGLVCQVFLSFSKTMHNWNDPEEKDFTI